jgi:hypothetical protein
MGWKYSDGLSSFKKDSEADGEAKKKPGYGNFAPWVVDGFKKGKGPEGRPLMRMAALFVIIISLAWSASSPNALKRALVRADHPRTPIPIGIAVGDPPPWTVDNVRAVVDQVRPKAQACLQGWTGMAMNAEGRVVVEVVLTPEGPDGAALFDQVTAVPSTVANCLGAAIGSVPWPLPSETQSIPFPIIGAVAESAR